MRLLALFAVGFAALGAPGNAHAALFFLFDRADAAPNDRVLVRTGGTPRGFTTSRRVRPFQRPIRLYLVRSDAATAVRSRFDARLSFVGWLVPDRYGRGLRRFSVPPLDAGTYRLAAWCPACAPHSAGRTFFVQEPEQWVPRYRSQGSLRIAWTEACPVTPPNRSGPPRQPRTLPWYGNGRLWAALRPDGVYAVAPDRVGADGSIGAKLFWVTSPATRSPTVSGQRLDAAAPPLRFNGAVQGSFRGADAPSWATRLLFPSAGCWRVTARVRDVSLTYVLSVVVR